MAKTFQYDPFDAAASNSNPIRALSGAKKWVSATLDTSFGKCARFLKVGGAAGNVDYVAVDGTTITGFPVTAGETVFMEFTQLNSTSTATGLWWSD